MMRINEILEGISIAMIVLTRVPINSIFTINRNIAIHKGLWAFPVVGVLIGFFLFLLITLFENIGVARQVSVLISLSIGLLLTGALHEDGVADFFDSLGGRDYTQRQKILKDSCLGTYGVLSLITVILLKFLIISGLESKLALVCGLVTSSCLGRFSILLLVSYSDNSKHAGLTKQLKKVDAKTLIGCGIFSLIWILPAGILAIFFTIIFGYATIYLFLKFIVPFNRGLSGDILGLCVVFVEIVSLIIISTSFG